eukprot:TRINITY_DN27363_c0_g1_i1.p1 TRINITY_DN27363_c0_g1~~TRINITY_DN27363_c0_g1_i1.p1  ORF type:complete len:968 (+),score=181.99 TRINITY_DN27363_c0_g1_i1:110-3013(+)
MGEPTFSIASNLTALEETAAMRSPAETAHQSPEEFSGSSSEMEPPLPASPSLESRRPGELASQASLGPAMADGADEAAQRSESTRRVVTAPPSVARISDSQMSIDRFAPTGDDVEFMEQLIRKALVRELHPPMEELMSRQVALMRELRTFEDRLAEQLEMFFSGLASELREELGGDCFASTGRRFEEEKADDMRSDLSPPAPANASRVKSESTLCCYDLQDMLTDQLLGVNGFSNGRGKGPVAGGSLGATGFSDGRAATTSSLLSLVPPLGPMKKARERQTSVGLKDMNSFEKVNSGGGSPHGQQIPHKLKKASGSNSERLGLGQLSSTADRLGLSHHLGDGQIQRDRTTASLSSVASIIQVAMGGGGGADIHGVDCISNSTDRLDRGNFNSNHSVGGSRRRRKSDPSTASSLAGSGGQRTATLDELDKQQTDQLFDAQGLLRKVTINTHQDHNENAGGGLVVNGNEKLQRGVSEATENSGFLNSCGVEDRSCTESRSPAVEDGKMSHLKLPRPGNGHADARRTDAFGRRVQMCLSGISSAGSNESPSREPSKQPESPPIPGQLHGNAYASGADGRSRERLQTTKSVMSVCVDTLRAHRESQLVEESVRQGSIMSSSTQEDMRSWLPDAIQSRNLPELPLCLFSMKPFGEGRGAQIYQNVMFLVLIGVVGFALSLATEGHVSLVAYALAGLLGLLSLRRRRIDMLLGPADRPLQLYADTHEFLELWQAYSMRRGSAVIALWFFTVLPKVLTSLDIVCSQESASHSQSLYAFLPLSCLVSVLVYCQLHVCCCLELSIDRFCQRYFLTPDLPRGIAEWNVCVAILRRSADILDTCFLSITTLVLVGALLQVVQLLQRQSTESGMVEQNRTCQVVSSMWVLPPVLLVIYAVFSAAAVTEKCTRVPALLNSLVTEGNFVDRGRQYLVLHIQASAAGFYVKGVRLTGYMALKFLYAFGAVMFALLSKELMET